MDTILDGVDYSQFPADLKAFYEAEHRIVLGISQSSINRHRDKLKNLPQEKMAWYILSNHIDIALHEAQSLNKKNHSGGAKAHLARCESQYDRFKKPSHSKKFKGYKGLL